MSRSCSSEYTAPDGFDGEHNINSRDFSVSAPRSCSAVIRKPWRASKTRSEVRESEGGGGAPLIVTRSQGSRFSVG